MSFQIMFIACSNPAKQEMEKACLPPVSILISIDKSFKNNNKICVT